MESHYSKKKDLICKLECVLISKNASPPRMHKYPMSHYFQKLQDFDTNRRLIFLLNNFRVLDNYSKSYSKFEKNFPLVRRSRSRRIH